LGVKVNSKRPADCWASQAFVSLGDLCGMIVEDQLDRCVSNDIRDPRMDGLSRSRLIPRPGGFARMVMTTTSLSPCLSLPARSQGHSLTVPALMDLMWKEPCYMENIDDANGPNYHGGIFDRCVWCRTRHGRRWVVGSQLEPSGRRYKRACLGGRRDLLSRRLVLLGCSMCSPAAVAAS
jgi:hypothetical protein